MGYNTNGLTFNTLRDANIKRASEFPDECNDWIPAQWLQALTGELGEYANIRKKFERGDIDEWTFKKKAAKELADIQTYLDILASKVGIDLGQATIEKWNLVSERIGSRMHIGTDGDWHLRPLEE